MTARTMKSPSIMAMRATELIFAEPGFPGFWCLFWVGFVFVFVGMELGVDETMLVGFVPGFSGEAMAPSVPGFVGSVTMVLHGCIGDPQRAWF